MVTVMENKAIQQDGAIIRVAVRILDARERQHLSQIIAVTGQRTGWTLLSVPCADADLVFVNPDDPGSQLLLERSREGRKPLAIAYGGNESDNINLPKPARSTELYQLLQSLQERLSQPESDPDCDEPRRDHRLVQTEDYRDLISFLAGVRERPQPVRIQVDDDNAILIDPHRGIAYLFGEQIQRNTGATLERLQTLPAGAISSVPRREFTLSLVDTPAAGISLEELAWLVCHKATPTRKQPRRVIEEPFRLLRWPNFSRLHHEQVHLLWCGSLMRESQTLAQLTARSSGGMIAAARFYNSCLVAGLLRHDSKQRDSSRSKAGASGRTSVFKRIIDKLAG